MATTLIGKAQAESLVFPIGCAPSADVCLVQSRRNPIEPASLGAHLGSVPREFDLLLKDEGDPIDSAIGGVPYLNEALFGVDVVRRPRGYQVGHRPTVRTDPYDGRARYAFGSTKGAARVRSQPHYRRADRGRITRWASAS